MMIYLLIIIATPNNAEEQGAQLYVQNCMVCHADDGAGAMPGVANLTENRTWSTISQTTLLTRLKQGIQTPGASITMPSKGGNPDLTDEQLLTIVAYMRQEFLNE